MRLTPADVHNVAFKKPSIGKRGYDEDEVDAFLDLVEAELSRLIEENNELTAKLAAYADGGAPVVTQPESEPVEVVAEPVVVQEVAPVAQVPEPAPMAYAPEPEPAPVVAAVPVTSDHHLQAARLLGLAQETADRLTAEAQAAAQQQREEAHAESQRLLDHAHQQSEKMVSDAKQQSEALVADAMAKAEAAERQSRLNAESMDREAERKYTEVMNNLSEQRSSLERKIDDLRTYEREYRTRLKGWISDQLTRLDDGVVTNPAADGEAGEYVNG